MLTTRIAKISCFKLLFNSPHLLRRLVIEMPSIRKISFPFSCLLESCVFLKALVTSSVNQLLPLWSTHAHWISLPPVFSISIWPATSSTYMLCFTNTLTIPSGCLLPSLTVLRYLSEISHWNLPTLLLPFLHTGYSSWYPRVLSSLPHSWTLHTLNLPFYSASPKPRPNLGQSWLGSPKE